MAFIQEYKTPIDIAVKKTGNKKERQAEVRGTNNFRGRKCTVERTHHSQIRHPTWNAFPVYYLVSGTTMLFVRIVSAMTVSCCRELHTLSPALSSYWIIGLGWEHGGSSPSFCLLMQRPQRIIRPRGGQDIHPHLGLTNPCTNVCSSH